MDMGGFDFIESSVPIVQYISKFNKFIKGAENIFEPTQKEQLFLLASAAEIADKETYLHVLRVGKVSKLIAEDLQKNGLFGIDENFVNMIDVAAALHDIGKIGISKDILLKQGRLTKEEFITMKEHVLIGVQIFDKIRNNIKDVAFANMCEQVLMFHHEKYDGTGYPFRVSGSKIPICAQIVILADIYDALRSALPYKGPMPHEDSIKIINEGKGSVFNPQIADAFIEYEKEIEHYAVKVYDYEYNEAED